MISSRRFWRGYVEAALALAMVAAGSSVASAAGELGFTGSLGLEYRSFVSDAGSAMSFDGSQTSLVASVELEYEDAARRNQFTLLPYARLDDRDSDRTHFDLREAYWRRVGSDWEVLVGLDRVFWGVTESRHLVDIVNQDDFVEDVDGEDKLGQPMVAGTLLRDWGTLSLYLLPLFRERTFPGAGGRLRPPLEVDVEDPVFESAAGERHVDVALRYASAFGDWDLGLSLFSGTSREPRLLPDTEDLALVPHYDQIEQFGVDVQHTRGAWLWKLEGMVRRGNGATFGAFVAGVEYTLYQALGNADLGLLVERLSDARDPLVAPPTIYDDDVFVGARLGFNDVQDSALLFGAIVDRDDGSTAIFVEGERRIGSRLRLEIESRLFTDVASASDLSAFRQDDFVSLRLTSFF